MELEKLSQKDIEEIVRKLSFKEAISFYLKILDLYSKTKNKNNFFVSHNFLDFIDNNFDRFRELIEEDIDLKRQLQNIFKTNIEIDGDNLVSIIIDDADNYELIEFLNEKLDFKDYYLNDKIMSTISAADTVIYDDLDNHQKKYIYSALYNVYYSREEQIEIYENNLKEYPESFIKRLFSYSEIICENTPNDIERYIKINQLMFNFTGRVIENPEKFDNYLYNVNNIYDFKPTEKDYYNTFLISMKYPIIHEELLDNKISNKETYQKLKVLSSLPPLKKITTLDDLISIEISDLYKMEIDKTDIVNNEPDSADARNDYEYEIFENNRQVIKITDDEIKTVQLTDDESIEAEYSHIEGLRKLYPEYVDKEVPGEIIIPANAIKHDIIIITEGDSINIWLPNIDNISPSQIDRLKEKLDEIKDISKISIIVASECEGNYVDIPFSTPEILIEYLKANRKVK